MFTIPLIPGLGNAHKTMLRPLSRPGTRLILLAGVLVFLFASSKATPTFLPYSTTVPESDGTMIKPSESPPSQSTTSCTSLNGRTEGMLKLHEMLGVMPSVFGNISLVVAQEYGHFLISATLETNNRVWNSSIGNHIVQLQDRFSIFRMVALLSHTPNKDSFSNMLGQHATVVSSKKRQFTVTPTQVDGGSCCYERMYAHVKVWLQKETVESNGVMFSMQNATAVAIEAFDVACLKCEQGKIVPMTLTNRYSSCVWSVQRRKGE